MIRTGLTIATTFPISAAPGLAEDTTRRVCFIGNRVTDTINYLALAELAKSRGYQQIWDRHMIPGAPLQWIWEHPKEPGSPVHA